jgi:hypothetical protein
MGRLRGDGTYTATVGKRSGKPEYISCLESAATGKKEKGKIPRSGRVGRGAFSLVFLCYIFPLYIPGGIVYSCFTLCIVPFYIHLLYIHHPRLLGDIHCRHFLYMAHSLANNTLKRVVITFFWISLDLQQL